MERAFERKLRFDPEKGVDYDAIPGNPDFHEWLRQQAEDCADCYDEEDETIPKFSLSNPPTKETE